MRDSHSDSIWNPPQRADIKTAAICAALLMLLTLLYSQLAQSGVSIKIAEPDWSMNFRPLQQDGGAPKLNIDEYALVDQLRPLLENTNYQQAITTLNKQWPAEPSAALFYIRAQISTQLNHYQSAEQDYQRTMEIHGEFILALQSLAGLSLKQQHHKKAQRYLAKTIALGGASADLFGQLGYLNMRYHSAFSAISAYQRAYSLEPENRFWRQGLLLALSKSGAFDQVNALADELLEKDPNKIELWLHKANAAVKTQRKEEALSALEMAIRLGNTDKANLKLLAQLHLQAGNLQRAVDITIDHQSLISDYQFVKPMLAWLARHRRWTQLQILLEQSEAQFKHYRAQERSHWHTQKASFARHQQHFKRQKSHLQQAVKLNPANGEALMQLADVHQQSNRLSQADVLLSRASGFDEYREPALLKRAQIAYQRQQYRSAFDLMNQVLRINPSRRDLVDNMDILQRLIRQQQQQKG